jgi:hypothetical protein
MEKRQLAAFANPGSDGTDQRRTQASTSEVAVGAHRTDFRPSRRVQPLPRHGNKSSVDANAVVAPHLDGTRKKRSGLGALDQRQNFGNVAPSEKFDRRINGDFECGTVHLHRAELIHNAPPFRRLMIKSS